MKRHFAAARLDVYRNKFKEVSDISADDKDLPTPHFTVDRIPKGTWKLEPEQAVEKKLEVSETNKKKKV
mgnify:CR=1 FL=1